jgi:two-component system, LytTR family, response regulator LytT
MQTKILIVEDEQKTALMLKEFIEWHANYSVAAICDSIETTVAYLRQHQQDLDVIFMDIQLSDGQCFEIFDKISVTLPIVFCTSYDEYVLKSLKHHGIDYIVKPFSAEDIRQTIAKVEALKGSFATPNFDSSAIKEVSTEKPTYQTSFLIRFREKIYPVAVADIAFVYLENETAYLYNFKGEKHPLFKTLDEIENAISPDQFYRINRQTIVNRKAIKEIEPHFNQKVVVKLILPTPEQNLVSRQKVTPFLAWIEKG